MPIKKMATSAIHSPAPQPDFCGFENSLLEFSGNGGGVFRIEVPHLGQKNEPSGDCVPQFEQNIINDIINQEQNYEQLHRTES